MSTPITPTAVPRPIPTYAPVESSRPPDDWVRGTSGGEVGGGVEGAVVLESARLTYVLDLSVVVAVVHAVGGWTGVDAKVNAVPGIMSDKQSPVIWPGMPRFNE